MFGIVLSLVCLGFSLYFFWRWGRIRKTGKATLFDVVPPLGVIFNDPVEGVFVKLAVVLQFVFGLVFAIVALFVLLTAVS